MGWRARCLGIAALLVAGAASASEIRQEETALLPIKALRAVVVDGETVFISQNGRFIIKGALYDVWQKKRITDFADIQKLATHLDLKQIGLDVKALNSVVMGGGSKEVVVFVSPHCSDCRALIQAAKTLTAGYRFQLLFISGDKSVEHTIQNIVQASSSDAALEAVIQGRAAQLPQVATGDANRHATTMLLAQLMEIDTVPFLVGPDGRLHKGLPRNLQAWLESKN